MKLKIVILISLITLGFGFDKKSDSPAQRFLTSLPESEKTDFLVLSLVKGYQTLNSNIFHRSVNNLSPKLLNIQPGSVEKFETLTVPENFETNLYLYTQDTFQLSQKNMNLLIRARKVCFNRKKCINIDDIGNMCCPF